VLHDITCEFREGEVVAIVGPNGSGKSSLLKCLNHLAIPHRGTIHLDGNDVLGMHQRDVARNFGYVPQFFQDSFPATVMDTVMMGRRPHATWRSGREDREKVFEVLRLFNLESFALRYHSELSGGQRQQVMIARAFAQESRVFLFDEPTSQLDIRHQLEILDLVRRIVREKQIISIIVVHDLNLAARNADRIMILREGRIHVSGSPREVITTEHIGAVYGVVSLVRHDDDIPYVVPKAVFPE
jgi:iron complex transport system ATP-binding protein